MPPSRHPYNSPTILGTWIFHRHGDRSPNRFLGPPQFHPGEVRHWRDRLPREGEFQGVDVRVSPSQNGGRFLDVGRAPFGHLSKLGMQQMRTTGKKFRARCDRYGPTRENDQSFLERWDVRAYSTNYLRTAMSAQCFLDGLIGTGERLEGVGVEVRDKEIDTLNSFDRRPEMMNELVRRVIETEQFQRIDRMALPLANKLSEFLPGLRGIPQAFGGTPSGINWIHANDHFVCRRAHSLPLLSFTEFQGRGDEGRKEEELVSMEIPVMSHLSWRFREWYSSPKLLSAVSSPPLREILHQMMHAVNAHPTDRQPFVLYSCHDVTLLGLLYAIGADFLVSGDDCGGTQMRVKHKSHFGTECGLVETRSGGSSWRWWPPYSSTIAFELVRVDDASVVDGYGIRVILNGTALGLIPVLSMEDERILKDQPLHSRVRFGHLDGSGVPQLMGLGDFSRMIDVLDEAAGGCTFSNEKVRSQEKEAGGLGVDGG